MKKKTTNRLYQMTFSHLSLPLPYFSFLCFLLKIEPASPNPSRPTPFLPASNHQQSAAVAAVAAAPVGTSFGKRAPEMSLINSLRRRGQRRRRGGGGGRKREGQKLGWLNNDREGAKMEKKTRRRRRRR